MTEWEVGDIVEVTRAPAGCCGVLRIAWWGKIISVIDVYNDKTNQDEQIVVLEDTTLVWGHEIQRKQGSVSIS